MNWRVAVRTALTLLPLCVTPSFRRLAAQDPDQVDRLAIRLASMTAITGLEQAMTDSLLALLPGSARDRAGNVTLTLGNGSPRRLLACPLDEIGYVVGNITMDGYITLRRVGGWGRVAYPLYDQQLEGHRVTVFGGRAVVPGVVAVRSTHLARGRSSGAGEALFTVDNAYVDVGTTSAAEVRALGIDVLAPVALAKRPQRYGTRLLAAPAAGRRAACAALLAALLAKPRARGTVVAVFTVQSLYGKVGLESAKALQGPFDEVKELGLTTRYGDTAVETVSLADAEALMRELAAWMGESR